MSRVPFPSATVIRVPSNQQVYYYTTGTSVTNLGALDEGIRGRSLDLPTDRGARGRSASHEPLGGRARRGSNAGQTITYVAAPAPRERQRSLSASGARLAAPDPALFARTTHGSKPPTLGPTTRRRTSSHGSAPSQILFYGKHEPYYNFTNFAPCPVKYIGREYPTSEHLFQAMKFIPHRPGIAEHIRTGSTEPRFAFTEAKRFGPEVTPDWFRKNIQVMDHILELKFTQSTKLRRELLGTGNAELIENAGANDDFWGNGGDGQGRNELGKALMRLRTRLAYG